MSKRARSSARNALVPPRPAIVIRASYPSVRRVGRANGSKGSIVYGPVCVADFLIGASRGGSAPSQSLDESRAPAGSLRRPPPCPAEGRPAERGGRTVASGRSGAKSHRWNGPFPHRHWRSGHHEKVPSSAAKTWANGTGSTACGLQPVATRKAISGRSLSSRPMTPYTRRAVSSRSSVAEK